MFTFQSILFRSIYFKIETNENVAKRVRRSSHEVGGKPGRCSNLKGKLKCYMKKGITKCVRCC